MSFPKEPYKGEQDWNNNGQPEREGYPGVEQPTEAGEVGEAVEAGEAAEVGEAGDERERTFLEIVHGVIFSPIRTMAAVGRLKPFWPSFFLLLGINLLTMAAVFFSSFQDIYLNNIVLQQLHISPEMIKKGLLVIAAFIFFVKLFFLFVYAGLLNLFGEFVGGKSNGIGLLTGFCLTSVPDIFYTPLLLLGSLLPGGRIVFNLGNVLLGLWSFGLSVLAVRETLELSTLRAFLVVFLPVLLGIAVLVTLIIGAFAVFAL